MKNISKKLIISFVTVVFLVSCITYNLDSIVRVQQPDNITCGAACVKMVMDYYFSSSEGVFEIFDKVSGTGPKGLTNLTYKMTSYFDSYNLYSSIIRFSDLKTILEYCDTYQIPAIMQIHATGDISLGHYVVFIQYKTDEGLVKIRDPADAAREWINYADLEYSFLKLSPDFEIGGNIIILANKSIKNKQKYICSRCNKENIIDKSIMDAITFLYCINCEAAISIWN